MSRRSYQWAEDALPNAEARMIEDAGHRLVIAQAKAFREAAPAILGATGG